MYILLFGMDDQRKLFYQDVISRKVQLKRFASLTESSSSAYVIDRYNKGLHELIVSKVSEKKLETVEELKNLRKSGLAYYQKSISIYPLEKILAVYAMEP